MGVAPVGASDLRAVSVAVAEPQPLPPATATFNRNPFVAEQRIAIEIVVLSHHRANVDARPDELRRRRAAAKYRDQEASESDPTTRDRRPFG